MKRRYYFDLRNGGEFLSDEEGIELLDVEFVKREAAHSLADILRDELRTKRAKDGSRQHIAVEVRDDAGPVFEARCTLQFGSAEGVGSPVAL
jgi:hypothetical protein